VLDKSTGKIQVKSAPANAGTEQLDTLGVNEVVMNFTTKRQEVIEIRSSWVKLLFLMFLSIGATALCWMIVTKRITDLQEHDFGYWVVWFGIGFFGLCAMALFWQLMHFGEVVFRIYSEGIWLKDRGDGLTIPWKLVDNVKRSTGKYGQYLVLEMSDENYKILNRGKIQHGLFNVNKILDVRGIPLNTTGTSVSDEQFESWILLYWNNWKEFH
jgi:hypothetical protein